MAETGELLDAALAVGHARAERVTAAGDADCRAVCVAGKVPDTDAVSEALSLELAARLLEKEGV